MKIKVWENKALDTKTQELIEINKFDEECVGIPILFNIHKEGKDTKCSVADAKNVRHEQDYNKMVEICKKVGKEPMVHIENNGKELLVKLSVYESKSKVGKAESNKRKEEPAEEKRLDTKSIFSKSLTKEERQEIAKENRINNDIRKGIVIDYENIEEPTNDKNYEVANTMYKDAYTIMENALPFYHGIICMLDHKFTNDKKVIPTMGVTTSELVMNINFVKEIKPSEVLFVLSHEAGHIAFKHPARIHKRNHSIWNMAGDLIINKTLCEEFDITPEKSGYIEFEGKKYEIEFAHGGLYSDKIDLDKDTTESVYDELMAEIEKQREQQRNKNKNQQQNNNQQSSSGGESGQ